jgi:hypothetical protein
MTKSPTILTTWSAAVLAAVIISVPDERTARADERPMESRSPVDLTMREVGTDGQDARPDCLTGKVILKLDGREPRAVSVVDRRIRFRLPGTPPGSREPGRSPVKVPSLWHAEVLVP